MIAPRIGIIGEFDRSFPLHLATNEAIQHGFARHRVEASIEWLATAENHYRFNLLLIKVGGRLISFVRHEFADCRYVCSCRPLAKTRAPLSSKAPLSNYFRTSRSALRSLTERMHACHS
jgi:hypothetical protein